MRPPVSPSSNPDAETGEARPIRVGDPDRTQHAVDYVLNKIHRIVSDADEAEVRRALESLEHAQRIFLYGSGRSGLVARAFAIRLMHLGYQTYVIGETITAPVAKGDLVLLISGSGETYPVVMTAEIAHKLGATVVSITRNTRTGIARLSDIIIHLDVDKAEDPQKSEFAPLGTLFESATWILLDGLVADLMVRMGQTEVAMRKRHATLE